MEYKSKFVRSNKHKQMKKPFSDHYTNTYSYRGYEYDIDYDKSGCYMGQYFSAKGEHISQQNHIDSIIEHEKLLKSEPNTYENTAEYGLKTFWDYCEENQEELPQQSDKK